jgi:hypothetical protein
VCTSLPGGIPVLTDADAPRAYARGTWRYEQMLGYTSVGCGTSIVDICLSRQSRNQTRNTMAVEPMAG